jgi:hypothetical protein
MALSEAQLRRVERMCRDEWESESELCQFFDSVTDAEELHLYASGFNWDCGFGELRRVIQHPLCDRGTARLIYWRAGPRYFAKYRDRSEAYCPDVADQFDLLQEIERKVIAGEFKTYRFPYDPGNDKGHDMTQRHSKVKTVREIPKEMFE